MKNNKVLSQNIILVGLTVLALVGCGASGNKPNVELIQDMMESPATKAQEYDETAPQNRGMRLPPEHTVPVGFTPYKYKGDPMASDQNKNPMSGDFDQETLIVGQKYYDTQCAVCHGFSGKGDGPVAEKMPLRPPQLLSDKVKSMTDGRIYHIITEGQGVMGPYASHIPQKYRWQVVNYIRHIQKQ